MLGPISCLIVGIALVMILILVVRLHAFLALAGAAIIVALLSVNIETGEALGLVTTHFGNGMAGLGILIVLAAIIGNCLMESGAADRIVRAFTRVFGQGREEYSMLASGFVLSVPVFFDTVFYLLAPLARVAHSLTKANYVLLVCAISAGGVITHTLVPPTPGPLFVAGELGVSIGRCIFVGVITAIPPALLAGIFYARWISKRIDFKPGGMLGVTEEELEAMAAKPDSELPSLFLSCVPFVLPIFLLGGTEISRVFLLEGSTLLTWIEVVGNKNVAFFLGALFGVFLVVQQKKISISATMKKIEPAMANGAVIALITCAGGAFGKILADAGAGDVFKAAASQWGIGLLPMAFFAASLIRIAQGSATVAMTTVAPIVYGAMNPELMSYDPVYLVMAIGLGACGWSWMNDSGFWIFGKLTGLNEVQTLKTWSAIMSIMAATGFLWLLILTKVLPAIYSIWSWILNTVMSFF